MPPPMPMHATRNNLAKIIYQKDYDGREKAISISNNNPWDTESSKQSLSYPLIDPQFIQVKIHGLESGPVPFIPHVIFTIESSRDITLRRFNDFKWLFEYLVKKYPIRSIPRLPQSKARPHVDEEFMRNREMQLCLWLSIVSCHPIIGKDDVVKNFISCSEQLDIWKFKISNEPEEMINYKINGHHSTSNFSDDDLITKENSIELEASKRIKMVLDHIDKAVKSIELNNALLINENSTLGVSRFPKVSDIHTNQAQLIILLREALKDAIDRWKIQIKRIDLDSLSNQISSLQNQWENYIKIDDIRAPLLLKRLQSLQLECTNWFRRNQKMRMIIQEEREWISNQTNGIMQRLEIDWIREMYKYFEQISSEYLRVLDIAK